MTVSEDVDAILAYGDCCDACLGRFFGKRSHGLSNEERGRSLRIARAIERHEPYVTPSEDCCVCGGLFDSLDEWADRVVAALDGLEYATILVGTRVPPLLSENEEMIWSDLSLSHAEPMKSETNREIGKRVSARTGRMVDFKHPDVVVVLDIEWDGRGPAFATLHLRTVSQIRTWDSPDPLGLPGLPGSRVRTVQLYREAVPRFGRRTDRAADYSSA